MMVGRDCNIKIWNRVRSIDYLLLCVVKNKVLKSLYRNPTTAAVLRSKFSYRVLFSIFSVCLILFPGRANPQSNYYLLQITYTEGKPGIFLA